MNNRSAFTLALLLAPTLAHLTTPFATAGSTRSGALRLTAMSAVERLGAVIQVELDGAPNDSDAARASEAEILWRIGRYDASIDKIDSLENAGREVSIGLQWVLGRPTPSANAGPNFRIGSGSTAEAVALDRDRLTGNLFALVDWGSAAGWSLYISVDNGAAWSETYHWCCGFELIDLVIADGFVYLAYTDGGDARLRRAYTSDGQIDATYNFQTVLQTVSANPVAIELTSNVDGVDDRLDYTILLDDGTLRHFWALTSPGTGFSEASPDVIDADAGLSVARNIGWPGATGEHFLMLSYVAAGGSLMVHRLGNGGWDGGVPVATSVSTSASTSIAAFQDTVMLAFEAPMPNGQGISYRITYDGGASWGEANLAIPGPGESFHHPFASARSGSGTVALYQQAAVPTSLLHFQQRHNYAPGSWMSRTPVNDHDFVAGSSDFDGSWIGSGWAVAYIDDLGSVWFSVTDAIFYHGFERDSLNGWSGWQGIACDLGTDSDGDRLDDCVETNTGVFASPSDTGTDPFDADTDGDAIDDGDEVLGTLAGLDLPAMGTNPLRKDVLVEYDWFSDSLGCALHEHRPTGTMIARLTNAFAVAPVLNPDGSTGINYIHDYGQGGIFTGGDLIDDEDGILVGGVNGTEFLDHKAANLAPERVGYFHYAILPHYYNTNSGSSGQAEVNGDDLIVSLRCGAFSTIWVSNTIAHELGHNLGLRHGGFENCNYKPNYNSVMNYRFQLNGVDSECDTDPDGILDYSYGDRVTLNENNLDENLGVCGAPPIDWDSSGTIDSGVLQDVNPSGNSTCGGAITTLSDSNDWASLFFGGILDADGVATIVPREIVDCVAPLSVD